MQIPSHASAGRATSPHLIPVDGSRRIGRGALALAGLILTLAALVFASSADAAVTCSHTGDGPATITLGEATPMVSLYRSGGGLLVKQGSIATGTNIACSPDPVTVLNTSSISIVDAGTDQATTTNISLEGGALEPGPGAFELGDSEIEVSVDGGSAFDTVNLTGRPDPAVDDYRLGTLTAGNTGVNLNAAETAPDGDDITFYAVDQVNVRAEVDPFDAAPSGSNRIDATGGPEFTGPFPIYVNFFGGGEEDVLIAPTGGSALVGFDGDDLLVGGQGADTIRPSRGNDTVNGGPSSDTLSYLGTGGDVYVDLRVTAPQDTLAGGTDTISGFENLSGDNGGNDTLIGTDGPNFLSGGESVNQPNGSDVLIGLGGADTMYGGNGNDVVSYAQGSTGPVTLDLGLTTPQATGGAGTDDLPGSDIENVIGSQFADTLTGTAGPNVVRAGAGQDTVSTLAGEDNVIVAEDATADTVDCGADTDTAVADKGLDALTACENVTLLDVPVVTPPADTTAPQTRVTKVTKKGRRVTLRFTSSEPGSTFECKLDRGPFKPCTSPRTYRKLGFRKHTFRVRAVDAAGNRDGSAAVRKTNVKRGG